MRTLILEKEPQCTLLVKPGISEPERRSARRQYVLLGGSGILVRRLRVCGTSSVFLISDSTRNESKRRPRKVDAVSGCLPINSLAVELNLRKVESSGVPYKLVQMVWKSLVHSFMHMIHLWDLRTSGGP